jgi:hypothetical protein
VQHVDLILLFLLVAVAALTVLARALDVPYPITLVVGGSLVGFVPGVPPIVLDSDLVLLIFLPPLRSRSRSTRRSTACRGRRRSRSARSCRRRTRWRRPRSPAASGCPAA